MSETPCRWKWGKSHARIDFQYPILVQNDNKKKNKGSQMGNTDKKILKKRIQKSLVFRVLNFLSLGLCFEFGVSFRMGCSLSTSQNQGSSLPRMLFFFNTKLKHAIGPSHI
jgi:hypothetical protein